MEQSAVPVFFLSDSTGITAETMGNALLIQFPDLRFERRVKNLRALLDRVTADGFDAWAPVTAETTDAASLAFRDLGA